MTAIEVTTCSAFVLHSQVLQMALGVALSAWSALKRQLLPMWMPLLLPAPRPPLQPTPRPPIQTPLPNHPPRNLTLSPGFGCVPLPLPFCYPQELHVPTLFLFQHGAPTELLDFHLFLCYPSGCLLFYKCQSHNRCFPFSPSAIYDTDDEADR